MGLHFVGSSTLLYNLHLEKLSSQEVDENFDAYMGLKMKHTATICKCL